ncbi:MAG: DHA2 family efflux MFS transporter permease subunit [Enterococcus sp.]
MTHSIEPTKLPKNIMAAAWAIALGAIAPMLDSTMLTIAIKQLTLEFDASLDLIQWGITGYVLALAMAVPVAGWLMNRWNGKKIFLGAVLLFGITSILTGISWNSTSFILFRFVQGFSAGIITPLMSTLLVKTAGKENIGRVISIVTTPMIFGPILGPVLGGFILQIASWRWLFFVNVFVVAIAVPLMHRYIPEFEPFQPDSQLDGFGIGVLSLLSASLIYGITKASDHATFNNSETGSYLLIGGGLFLFYVYHNYRKENQTVLPLNLFKQKNYLASSVGLFLANIALMGPMMIFPLFFQTIRQYNAMGAAIAMIPQGVGMLITRPFIGKTIDKIGAKYVVLISLLVSLIGSVPLIFVTEKTSAFLLAVLLFIRGMSVGGINLPLTSDAYTGLSDEQLPEAGVGITIIENVGSSFGSALIATAVAAFSITGSSSISAQLNGYHAGFLLSTVALILIVLPALFLTNKQGS